jgi:hypothetical protein
MKSARVKPFIGKVIVHPGALEAWFARVDDEANKLEFEAQFGNTGTHEPVSKESSSTADEVNLEHLDIPIPNGGLS